jgi:uncharacterized protein (TIGR03437 family)
MLRILGFILAGAAFSAAQVTVFPQRIAGVPIAEWSIGDGGPASNALLTPTALAWDRAGNLLIADSRNQRIRRLAPDGTISTVVPQIAGVYSMAVDSRGNLYVSVSPPAITAPAQILEIAPSGGGTQIAGAGSMSISPGIAIDGADNLYITDQTADGGGFVWKRSALGTVQKIAGSGTGGIPGQSGPALQVTLGGPHALAFDASGNLLIADWSGILRLNPDGTLIRLVQGWSPSKIVAAADGSIYWIGDYYGIQRWSPAGGVTQFAGTAQSGFSDGCALSGGKRVAKYASIDAADLTFDSAGRLYIADDHIATDPGWFYSYQQGRLRRIDPDGSIRTVAGTGSMPLETPPGGLALQAIFHNPEALAVDSSGNVFFAESGANRVQEITAAGQFLTLAGSDSAPPGEDAACYAPAGADVLSAPSGVAVDAAGNLYISDTGRHRILRRTPEGTIATIAGTGTPGQTGDGGPAVDAEISSPASIALKPDGSIYFVTYFLNQYTLRRIRTDGIIETPAAPQGIGAVAVGFDGGLILSGFRLYKEVAGGAFYPLMEAGNIFAADRNGAVYGPWQGGMARISANCNMATIGFTPGLISQFVQGVANDSQGNLYLSADNSVWRIPAVTPPVSDAPSVALDSPGVFNDASNLTIRVIGPPVRIFEPPSEYQVNDSITGNEILHITGACMGPLAPSQASPAGAQLPTGLQGTQVLFDGVAAPLLSVQATEILAIAPQDVASKSKVTIAVDNQRSMASTVLNAAPAVPGIFLEGGSQAAAINQDGSLNGPDHPAPIGSVVSLFLTGAGATNPASVDGIPPTPPLPQLALPVTVQVGGSPAAVLYAGAASGLTGMAQVNIVIPATAAGSAVPIQVSVGGNSRDQIVTLAVQ